MRMTERVTVITRATRLAGLLQRWGTRGQARFRFKANKMAAFAHAGNLELAAELQKRATDADFEMLESEANVYQDAVSRVTRDLDLGVPVQVIDRSFVPNYDFSMTKAVVVLGQDRKSVV